MRTFRTRRLLAWLLSIAALFALVGCAHRPAATPQATPWNQAGQLVLVTIADWDADHGTLQTYERDTAGHWRAVMPSTQVVIGRKGAAWGIGLHDPPADGPVKREGDGRSPAGVFAIGEAFGYAPHANTALPYAAMSASHYCIDVSGSPLYNRIVDADVVGADAVAGSTEPMRLDLHAKGDQRYRLGFVIEHNPRGVAGAGSCIFAHLWKEGNSNTAGCTAMADSTMDALLPWLDAKQQPIFVLLPQHEYALLREAWDLPDMQGQP
ncbi:hypothetical protein [Lysobacter sp. CFH 32150]|uniref:L,D-transpeptidase family protein n=1 Tax=Lysobacter sp. CFH 32150 TaxID=2927128 RepID=UPI001FA7853D|nr:hypothetical protein [Lysobacter sp. CFH 32150]MCI4567406.1 hypothetical protein [Lysobacter sp. CFH 32150]